MRMKRWLGVGDSKGDEEVAAVGNGKDDKVDRGRRWQGE